ncbi:biotin--[acetyl-CoA-carboxylase] ligase [Aquibacillus sediminis]|uniref:biotin--[acetyl-CoA-carboxylase] ligase n=1 Tax=Aquibacillus sediminis TaxID=2574734 RepID=UPI001107D8D2|nr:biotin--[acetyl-CoA-carboxylase] ligase [Aquibacillus sediminis]
MESTRNQLIKLLEQNQDKYMSGQELSKQLNISRTAVWKHMNELKKDGYVIDAISNKGYQIKQLPQQKLSSNTLHWGLHTTWLGQELMHKDSISSTQTLGHQLAVKGAEHGTVIIADQQTGGKGRMDRRWESDNTKGIWMSIILKPKLLPHHAPQITLLAATVLADLIQEDIGITTAIKWPNDVLVNDKKVAGILTEMQAEQDQIKYMVLGIGFNVNQTSDMLPDHLQDIATSIKMESNQSWNQRELVQQLLHRFEDRYDQFIKTGFSTIKTSWESYGYKLGETVTISTFNQQRDVKLIGIEKDGALRVETLNGEREILYSAEIHW